MKVIKWRHVGWALCAAMLACVALGILWAGGVAVADDLDVVIDEFSAATMDITHTISDTIYTYPLLLEAHGSGAGMLGGYRDLCLTVTSGDNGRNAQSGVQTVGKYLYFDNGGTVQATAEVQWDGDDVDCDIDPIGLRDGGSSGVDITNSGNNTGILVRVIDSDGGEVSITVTVYRDASNYAYLQVGHDYRVNPVNDEIRDIFMSFSDFTKVGTLDYSDVGAVVLTIETVDAGADLSIATFLASTRYEYGDLPLEGAHSVDYMTQVGFSEDVVNARHIVGDMTLGASVDSERTHNASVLADGDDLDGYNDEDGVTQRRRDCTEGTINWSSNPNFQPGGCVALNYSECTGSQPCTVATAFPKSTL
jgi:hypothetical protein